MRVSKKQLMTPVRKATPKVKRELLSETGSRSPWRSSRSSSRLCSTVPTTSKWVGQPGHVIVRAATDAKHESGLSTSCLVVSYGSAMEVWALLMRLSHYLRTRGEVSAVVPRWRAAWARWHSAGVIEIAVKHCFSMYSTEHSFQTQTLSIFHDTRRSGLTDEISSPHASVSTLVLQLFRYSIAFPLASRRTVAILRTPTRLTTTPHSLLWSSNSGALAFADWLAYCHPPLWLPN